MIALLYLHAFAGTLALVIAPLAMLASKGSDAHRRWGKVFFYAMSVVVVTAIIAGIVRPNILMALVALFSFHMLASGYRALYLKKLHEGQRMQRWDYILQGSAAVINGALFLWGLINLTMGRRDSASIIFFVFGSVGLFMVWRNVHQFFKRSVDKREWLYMHMTGFLGGYIATVSAFSAVNLHMIQPTWLQWLWPTIIGSPLIAYWISYYRKGFAKGKRVSDMVRTRIQ
jgi:fluoride ion exporter CrcB/FEX